MITATRYHDFSMGHRVAGHENKCAFLHGHNYRVHFTCSIAELDSLGRVVDFSVIKTALCEWLEDNWDHKMVLWEADPLLPAIMQAAPSSVVVVPFNPTAENMANHLLRTIGPIVLPGDVRLIKVVVEETRKCSAEAKL